VVPEIHDGTVGLVRGSLWHDVLRGGRKLHPPFLEGLEQAVVGDGIEIV